jgi:hypothetical protein
MTTVRFVDVPDSEWTKINFAYDVDLVELVKQCSAGLRTYDRDTKTWSVLDDVAVQLAETMTKAGHVVLYGDEPPPPPRPVIEPGFFAPTNGYDADAVAAGLISALPGQHVGAVFRAMAKQLYPDLYRRR